MVDRIAFIAAMNLDDVAFSVVDGDELRGEGARVVAKAIGHVLLGRFFVGPQAERFLRHAKEEQGFAARVQAHNPGPDAKTSIRGVPRPRSMRPEGFAPLALTHLSTQMSFRPSQASLAMRGGLDEDTMGRPQLDCTPRTRPSTATP